MPFGDGNNHASQKFSYYVNFINLILTSNPI